MFKVGDKVRCTSTGQPGNWLTLGKIYEVLGFPRDGYTKYIGDNGKEQGAYNWRFELVKPEPQAAAIAGGLQEHSVGEYYPLAAVMYEHNGERIITIENLQTGEVARNRLGPICFESFEDAYKAIEKPVGTTYWVKGRVMYVSGYWQVLEDPNQVRVTRLRNMLHRG